MLNRCLLLISFLAVFALSFARAAEKPKLTLDDFFNYVDILSVSISPDGNSVVINTERADWVQNIFRRDLWLYRDDGHGGGGLTQLTQSGDNTKPQWSPDGRWIAFLSERKSNQAVDASGDDHKEDALAQLYLIPLAGGEAFPVTQGDDEVHSFSWSPNSRTLYFATPTPWTKTQKDAYKKEWKDVLQYRAAERGDMIFSMDVGDAIARRATEGTKPDGDSESDSDATPGSHALAITPWRVHELEASPDGSKLAFVTTSVSEREEKVEEFEIYSVGLANASPDRPPLQLTHNQAVEQDRHWAKDGTADPDRLTVGGHSYGGYMANWLITRTTRFKAAVTGGGAVENVANWGNDDTTFDDAYFLGGFPWDVPKRYQDEAAIYQMNKVHTPTHIVSGADDIRVAVAEAYLLDHALHALGVPSTLLIFPGEGHELDKNPWHGKIKVREELKWLEKYGGITPAR